MLSHLDSLPTLPPVVVKLLALTSSPDSTARDVVELLSQDQTLVARVLAQANAARNATSAEITRVDMAVTRLGFKAVRNIVLAVKVFETFPPEKNRSKDGFDRCEFWRHALAVGIAASKLARARRELKLDADEAYLAGLLHDLGKVALSAVFPKAYDRVVMQARQHHCDIVDAERSVLGVDHLVAGRHIAQRWGLPRLFEEVIWLHHLDAAALPAQLVSPQMVALVRLADTLVREQRIGLSGSANLDIDSASLAERLGLRADALEPVVRELVRETSEQAEALGLDTQTPEEALLRAMNQANAELSQINRELAEANRRLEASKRYYQALAAFDEALGQADSVARVVQAMATSASRALRLKRCAAFGLHASGAVVRVADTGDDEQPAWCGTEPVGGELSQWLAEQSGTAPAPLPAPIPVRKLLIERLARLGEGECWLLPVVSDGRVLGGIVYRCEDDPRQTLAAEHAELRAYLSALGRTLAQALALERVRQLTDDLAETTRRLQQAQAEAVRSKSVSMIAEMAAGAAHELNSPLAVISGRAQMLQQQIDDPELRRSLEQIEAKAHECSRIVSELMEFARPGELDRRPVNLPALVRALCEQMRAEAKLPASRLSVSVETEPEDAALLERLDADPARLRAALEAVLRNALEATRENEGEIRVVLHSSGPPGEPVGATLGGVTLPARWVEIAVIDSGCGMPPAVARRVFEPFFSHRKAGRGRGLGLSHAYRIVEQHGGRMWVESALDQGTTVRIVLPLRAAGA